jgi:iron chelate uptake ABC transporter, feCT family, permease protein
MTNWTNKTLLSFGVLLFLAFIVFAMSIFVGSVSIPVNEVWNIITCDKTPQNETYQFIVIESRLPQSITAVLCGTALSVSGYLLQRVFRNALAGPSLLGVDAGAMLGVAIVMLSTNDSIGFMAFNNTVFPFYLLMALAGAFMVLMLVLLASKILTNNVLVLIVGLLVSYLVNSFISLLNFFAGAERLQAFYIWGLGSFGYVSWNEMPLFLSLVCAGILGAVLLIKPINLWNLGDHYATAMGLNVRLTRTLMLLVAGLLTACSVAFCGPIGFIGLAVPHLVMIFLRQENSRIVLPFVVLTGIVVALTCNILSCLPFHGMVLPLNVITPWIGAPVIIWVIVKHRV